MSNWDFLDFVSKKRSKLAEYQDAVNNFYAAVEEWLEEPLKKGNVTIKKGYKLEIQIDKVSFIFEPQNDYSIKLSSPEYDLKNRDDFGEPLEGNDSYIHPENNKFYIYGENVGQKEEYTEEHLINFIKLVLGIVY